MDMDKFDDFIDQLYDNMISKLLHWVGSNCLITEFAFDGNKYITFKFEEDIKVWQSILIINIHNIDIEILQELNDFAEMQQQIKVINEKLPKQHEIICALYNIENIIKIRFYPVDNTCIENSIGNLLIKRSEKMQEETKVKLVIYLNQIKIEYDKYGNPKEILNPIYRIYNDGINNIIHIRKPESDTFQELYSYKMESFAEEIFQNFMTENQLRSTIKGENIRLTELFLTDRLECFIN